MNSNEQEKPRRFCGHGRRRWYHFLFFIPMILAVTAVKAGLVMWLWNELIPTLFHGPVVNFLQAFGLLILAKLFVGFGFHGHKFGGGGPWGRHKMHRLHERMQHMTPEEREKMREKLHKRWGHWE